MIRHSQNSTRGPRAARASSLASHAIRLAIVALCLLLGWPALSTAQGSIIPTPRQVFLTNAGVPCNGCTLATYVAGSVNTDLATYSTVTLTTGTELPNPVTMNSAGRPQTGAGTETNIYLSQVNYKFVLRTSAGVTIWTADHVPAIPAIAVALDVTQTAGEALLAGEVVYLSDAATGCGATAGRWYKADADSTCSSSTAGMVGMVPSNIASGGSGSIRLSGRITGLSALTAGEKYYVSATAGALAATPPTNARYIAQADSTTSVVVGGNPGSLVLPDSDGTHSLVMRTSSNLTADRLLTLVPGDAARTVTISGDATISQDYSATGTPGFNTVGISDSDASHYVRLETTSNVTADRQITINPGDAARTVTLGGNTTTSADVTTTGAGNLTIAAGASNRTVTLSGDLTVSSTTTVPQTIQPGLTAVRVYTGNATWTKPAALHSVVVWVVGGGGGGGGSGNTGASQGSTASGGGGGGMSIERIVDASLGATEAVTVGASGAGGGTGSAGSTGGTSSFGALLSATGGAGGAAGPVQGVPTVGAASTAAGVGSLGDLNIVGDSGTFGFSLSSGEAVGGQGGASPFGGGARPVAGTNAGLAATAGYGGGGSGAVATQSASGNSGGAGAAGVVIVYEYSQ